MKMRDLVVAGVMGVVLLCASALGSGCAAMPGSNTRGLTPAPPIGTHVRTAFAHHLNGPGPVLTSKFAGQIFGWGIDENGTDGVLTEVVPGSGNSFTSIVEAFDQPTAQIKKVVRKQFSGPSGNRELAVEGILSNDVGLVDYERLYPNSVRRDIYYVMAPVLGYEITGTWTRPPGRNFLIYDIADQQRDPVAVMAATIIDRTIKNPPTFEVVVTDVATNRILHILHAPKLDGVNYPYLVAEDITTHHAYVPAANYRSETVFVDFDTRNGHVSNTFIAPPFSGPVGGIAIDSATHMMCTTTGTNYSVQMYDLRTKKQTFVGQIPNAGGEGQAGSSIAADPIHHVFLVEQPNSLLGGSEIYVYDEKGKVLEGLTGFAFAPSSGIQVDATGRTGYVAGPHANQLQSFTY